ncbi:MAG TPA: ABC transporter ATP-binding protein [Candidatus Limnocylindrales bacterium]|nr:ABC transporter ATP-binding protein [Candidatus Limnocylindrales bacterium]
MLLQIEELTKVYRTGTRANDRISLAVGEGEVFGLLGHNGAGKTTLVNQVVGLLRPTSGAIRIDGRDMVADPGLARRLCSFQAQAQVPIDGLTPRQAIDLLGQLRGSSKLEVRRRRERLVDALDLGEWLDIDAARLSGGVKRLVAFAMAAVSPGRVVMLDEPTNDVDPVRRRLLWRQVRTLADHGAAVLLVTHNVIEAERSVDRLAILDRGRVIAEGTPAELKARLGAALRLELVLSSDSADTPVSPFPGTAVSVGNRLMVGVPMDGAGQAVTWAESLQRAGAIEEFTLGPATLEDVYVALVGGVETGPAELEEARNATAA